MPEQKDKTPPPNAKAERREDGSLELSVKVHGKSFFGSTDESFWNSLVKQTLHACGVNDKGDLDNQLNALLAGMHGIDPQDEIEAMLATQMVATHTAAIVALGRFQTAKILDQANASSNQANKFMRTYTAQMEALKKHRAKAQQTVRVERVYYVVNEGQAVLGDIDPEGAAQVLKDQPHASEPLTYAPCETLPSQDAAGNALPIASHEKRAVPAARR